MHKTVVLCVVGLTPKLLGTGLPRLSSWAKAGTMAYRWRADERQAVVARKAQRDVLGLPAGHGEGRAHQLAS